MLSQQQQQQQQRQQQHKKKRKNRTQQLLPLQFFQPRTKQKPCLSNGDSVADAKFIPTLSDDSIESSSADTAVFTRSLADNVKENHPELSQSPICDDQHDTPLPPTYEEHSERKLRSSQNLIHDLHQQSTHGIRISPSRKLRWSAPSWLPFSSSCRAVVDMKFDATGVLLAVAYANNAIQIYDWDMLEAGDLRCRRGGSPRELSPVVDFVLSKRISFLKWNPFQQDILAIGIRGSGSVLLYDLSVVSAWRNGQGSIPHVELKTGVTSSVESSILFLNQGKSAIIACDGCISHWSLNESDSLAAADLQWTLQCSRERRISSVVSLDHKLILLGYTDGVLSLMDLTRLVKTPFSRKLVPSILKEFQTTRKLHAPSPEHMGIRGLQVRKAGPSEYYHIQWVTSCGWHLSTMLDVCRLKLERVQILYSTPRVQCRNARGDPLPQLTDQWSLPSQHKVQIDWIDKKSQVWVWDNVATVTQILPGRDGRAEGDDRCRYVRDDAKPALLWRKDEEPVYRIPLSKRKGRPTCFAIHPSLEWIAVGTRDDHMYLINSRSKIVE